MIAKAQILAGTVLGHVSIVNYSGPVDVVIRAAVYYDNKALCITAFIASGENVDQPYAHLSINFEARDRPELAANEFVMKTYSENATLAAAVIAANIFVRTGRTVNVGHAGPQPIFALRN